MHLPRIDIYNQKQKNLVLPIHQRRLKEGSKRKLGKQFGLKFELQASREDSAGSGFSGGRSQGVSLNFQGYDRPAMSNSRHLRRQFLQNDRLQYMDSSLDLSHDDIQRF